MFQYFDDNAQKLLRKGVFPYDYMDENWKNKLKEKELPDITYFHSSLSNIKCSNEDYSYAKETYKHFKYRNVKDYNDIYVQADVLLLGDVFASYRKKSYDSFGTDLFIAYILQVSEIEQC